MNIKSIILWPKISSNDIRKIDFNMNKISVITGQSQTGKSALIPIIDYCLGSRKCAIPVGIIRDQTKWFGLLLETESSQILLARREPGEQLQTSDMYMEEASSINIINMPSKNCTTKDVKNRLNELAGLSKLNFEGGESNLCFENRPSIRDMTAFEFQPQHIIANPYTLFFKADTYEHQQKLKNYIFPLVIGAIDSRELILIHERKELKKELKTAEREHEEKKSFADSWIAEIKAYYSHAKELGLLPRSPDPLKIASKWDETNYIFHLKRVPESVSDLDIITIKEGNTERAVLELNKLKQEEYDISHSIGYLRLKLSKMEELLFSEKRYENALEIQQKRLEGVGWFSDKINHEFECPFCKSRSKLASDNIKKLIQITEDVVKSTSSVQNSYPILDKEITDIKKDLRKQEKRLNIVRKHRKLLESKSETVKLQRQNLSEIYRFIGRLEQSLRNYDSIQSNGELYQKITDLKDRIRDIERKIDPKKAKRMEKLALDRISEYMSNYAKILGVERPEDPIDLDITNLTIKILSPSNQRKDYLWEIGSGANWMSYHLATLMALHEYFIRLDVNPVPQFLVLDQPSQVYFPERWPLDPNPKNPMTNQEKPTSDDVARTRKIFEALSEGFLRTSGKLQIIVIEHADTITWDGIENINLVERWRDGNALIPPSWE